MNRAERRKKKPSQQNNNPAMAWQAIQTMMQKKEITPLDDANYQRLLFEAHSYIHALTGSEITPAWATEKDFELLCISRAFCYFLAKYAQEAATTQEGKEQIEPFYLADKLAEKALVSIAERSKETGTYTANKEEESALLNCVAWLDALLSISTQGMAKSAMIEAQKLIKNNTN